MATTVLPTDVSQRLGQQVGFSGAFGGGAFQTYLNNNPQAKAQYDKLYQDELAKINAPQSITQYNSNQVQNPQLPVNAEFTPVEQQAQANELTNTNSFNTNSQTVSEQGIGNVQAPTIQGTNASASQVDETTALTGFDDSKGKYEASLNGTNTPQATAQQGQVNEKATVQGQLKDLTNFGPGDVPAWAKGAITNANEASAARGMGASSIGSAAIAAAIQQAALPIAAADANTYFQMDLANLNNAQQTELLNTQLRQQSMLSDQSATNASKQFNAASEAQTQQFMASLVTGIKLQNAQLSTSVSTFNAAEANKIAAQNAGNQIAVDEFNNQQLLAVRQFNAQLESQRNQFNSQMQYAIDQSNVNWRRSINTSNTVTANAANQANVQNRFNMSQTAMNNLWQQFRDEAAWIFQSSENAQDRAFNAAQAANNRDLVSSNNDTNLAMNLGATAVSWLLK